MENKQFFLWFEMKSAAVFVLIIKSYLNCAGDEQSGWQYIQNIHCKNGAHDIDEYWNDRNELWLNCKYEAFEHCDDSYGFGLFSGQYQETWSDQSTYPHCRAE